MGLLQLLTRSMRFSVNVAMPIGPEITPFRPQPELTPHEILIQRIHEKSGIHVMVQTDFDAAKNDIKRCTAVVLSQEELDILKEDDSDSFVTRIGSADRMTMLYTVPANVGLPMRWAEKHPIRESAATEAEAVLLAYQTWVACATMPPPTQLPLQ